MIEFYQMRLCECVCVGGGWITLCLLGLVGGGNYLALCVRVCVCVLGRERERAAVALFTQ